MQKMAAQALHDGMHSDLQEWKADASLGGLPYASCAIQAKGPPLKD
jgi:hypothetical protein